MSQISEVLLRPRSLDRFARIVGPERIRSLMDTVAQQRTGLAGRKIWTVNSTAAGGGVAEMLRSLLAYAQALGIDARWLVISGNPDFFRLTKRLHNALHGSTGDGSPLAEHERSVYEQVARANATELLGLVGSDDIVLLHDPQTAGLIPYLKRLGVPVMWRCHIGGPLDHKEVQLGWSFLEPYITQADALIFTREAYVPSFCPREKVVLVQPTIDPFSAKNQALPESSIRAILTKSGLVSGNANGGANFLRENGARGEVRRQVDLRCDGEAPSASTPLVVQVSRWDRLKDPLGVMNGFCGLVNGNVPRDANLVLAGPSVAEVADDPEGRQVYEEVEATWRNLAPEKRRRVHLATIPMDDLEENAAIVNALQRHATIIVQKSLQEGFGLTVTEAMWKNRPVVASAVGGIQDQIEDGVSGILVEDPRDLNAFTGHLRRVLEDRTLGEELGNRARERVVDHFLGLTSLERYAALIATMLAGGEPASS